MNAAFNPSSSGPQSLVRISISRWSKRAFSYGGASIAVSSALLYLTSRKADETLLGFYGLTAFGFQNPVSDLVIFNLPALFIISLMSALIFALSQLCFKSAGFILSWIGRLPALARISDTIGHRLWRVRLPQRVAFFWMLIAGLGILLVFVFSQAGNVLGSWRMSRAEWIVAANRCATDCYSYSVDGSTAPVTGYPVAGNEARLAVVVARRKIHILPMDKLVSVEAHKGAPVPDLRNAPANVQRQWKLLDLFNGRWSAGT